MATDPRALYPEDARRENLASFLVAGMAYRGQAIGVLRAYSSEIREFTDDEKNVLHAVAQLAAAAVHSAQQVKAQSEGRRIQRQVKLAADVQRQMLPESDPSGPKYEIAGLYDPCFELGGDFYDFIELEDHNVGIILGDVVGKGVGASLLMASVRASLRAHAEDVYDLDDVMSRVNRALYRDTLDSQFATVFYGTIDTKTLRLTYSSAGHEPSFLWRDGQITELQTGGMALGIDPTQAFDKGIEHLRPGDILLFYSDGVTDAFHFSGERFGRERLEAALNASCHMSAREIGNHVLWEVRRFMGLNDQTDDMTLVVVKIKGV
jgi:serine phosphatase RsbU (regulator of sigma subunit)